MTTTADTPSDPGYDYETSFDTDAYLDLDWETIGANYFGKWHNAACTNSSRSHQKLLDIGTGPSIISIASMSRLCDSITVSDYVPSNREALRKWILNEPGAHDWTKILQKIADVEGNGVTAEDIANRLRVKINPEVLVCDLQKENPFDQDMAESFDLITSQLCLISACRSHEKYQRVVSTLGKMLKPGGAMFEASCLHGSFYTVGKTKFRGLTLTEDLVKKAFENAGFSDISFQINMLSEAELAEIGPTSDEKGYFLVSAYKM